MIGPFLFALLILAAVVTAGYYFEGLAAVQFHGQAPSLHAVSAPIDFHLSLDSVFAALKERALYASFAGDAFSFGISWLGLIIATALLLFSRLFRRR